MGNSTENIHSTKDNLQVLYEDNHLIIVNKRVGDIVQGDKTGDKPLNEVVKSYIKEKYDKPGNVYLGTVHRIDRPTSGIVVFAKTSKALARLNKMLKEKQIEKTYWAIVDTAPPKLTDTLIHWLRKNPKNNKSTAFDSEHPEAKKAILHYELLKELNNYYLLEIKLETGRHHQIRVQLAAIGCRIKGDLKYGAKRSNPDGGISLHAKSILFNHPVKDTTMFTEAPLPEENIWQSCL